MKEKKERLLWLDNLKGFLILLVILGHCIQHTISGYQTDIIFRYIYSFHMPLFIFVSGFVCYRENLKWEMVSRRFVQLIIPFFIWSIVAAIKSWDTNIIIYNIVHPEKGLWFLWVLFFITLCHVICCRLSSQINCSSEVTSALVAVVLLLTMRQFDLFCYPTIAKFFMYYIIGFYMRKHLNLFDVFEKNYFIIFGLILFIVLAFYSSQIGAPTFLPERSNPVYGQLYNLLVSCIAIISFVLLFKKVFRNKLILSQIGGVTLGLYAIHRPIMSLLPLQFICYDNKLTYYILIFLLWILVSILSYVAVSILDKNKYTALLFNGKQ